MAPYLYHENVSKGLVKYAGRAAVAKDIYSKEDAFHQFVVMIQSNYPQQAETILARSDLKSCVVKKHKFITIANITVGTRARDTPAPGKQKACKDSDIELKTHATPMSSRNAGPNDEVPQFATVLDIFSVQPFMKQKKMKHQVYFKYEVIVARLKRASILHAPLAA